MHLNSRILFVLLIPLIFTGCISLPEGTRAVENFQVDRYLGKWYEIARLDHRFEQGLESISATYSLRPDGGIKVINSGYNIESGKLELAEGKAYFTGNKNIGSLKVSFFGPFYGGYHIIDLDQQDYQYAMVTGPNKDYLWILSRTPTLNKLVLKQLVSKAESLGYAVNELIYSDSLKTD